MTISNMNIKEVSTVLRYTPTKNRWSVGARNDHFIGIMLSGEAHHSFGGYDFTLSENTAFFFNAKDPYSVEAIGRCESLAVHFSTYEEIDTDSFCLKTNNTQKFIELLEKLSVLVKQGEERRLESLSLAYQIAAILSESRNQKYSKRDARIVDSKSYVDAHFTEKNCISVAVEISGLCYRRFSELFKLSFGVTPKTYVDSKKIAYAKTLLSSRTMSVEQVAGACGYCDVYYFSKAFKSSTGVSPSKWAGTQSL